MRKWHKQVTFVLMLLFSFSLCANTALAKTVESGNVAAEMKVESAADNMARVSVTVKNHGTVPIKNVHITGNIPKGLQLSEGSSAEKKIEVLGQGAAETLQYSLAVTTKAEQPTKDEGNEPNKPNNPSNPSSKVSNDGVKTGDDTNIALYLLLGICAVICMIICVKRKKLKGFFSLFLSAALIIALLTPVTVAKAEETGPEELSIAETCKINGKDYEVEAKISYDIPTAVVPSGEVLTRAQWIDELVTSLGYEGQTISYDDSMIPYSDIEGHDSKDEIMIAYGNSILLKEEDGLFDPDDAATREFTAVTAVRALAFEPVKDIVCEDAGEITYKQEAETAVAMNILQLDSNRFYPHRELTRSEADGAIAGINAVLKSENIDEGYESDIIYKEGVKELQEDVSYNVNGTTVTVTPASAVEHLNVGDTFVLPDQTPYKVASINNNGDSCVIGTSVPEIEETLSSIDAQGYGDVDMNGFIPADGVTITGQSPQSRANMVDAEGAIGGPGDIKFSIDKPIGIGNLTGSFSISVPRILYKADVDIGWSGFNVKNVYMKVPAVIKIDGGYSIESDGIIGDPKDDVIELGKVPVAGIPGVAVYVQIGLKLSVEGKVHVVFTLDGTVGVQVLNNRLRMIKDLNTDFQLPELEATAKLGPEVAGLLEVCRTWDLIDFSLSAGAAMSGTIIERNPNLACLDANAFMYGEISAMDKGIIGDWLNIGYTWDFWNAENSPIRENWHFENAAPVEACTFEDGKIKGTVAKASDRGTPIKDAQITIYNKGNLEEINSISTDENGNYEAILPEGQYIVVISADGYIPFEYEGSVVSGEEKYIETFLMVDEGQPGQQGVADGIVTDAVSGDPVEGAALTFRKGWNKTEGEGLTTVVAGADGKYQVQLPIGNYTAYIEKDGFVANTLNIVVLPVSLFMQNVSLVPSDGELPEGEMRIVLTWGETPRDLDSHLVGPNAAGDGYFHTYYADKSYIEDSVKYADLDLDDTTSYGPETTTIYKMNETGTYSFYVHDFTNGGNFGSTDMSASGAMVKVYKGGQLYASYPVPTGKQGVYWHVFDFDAGTNSIKPVNEFVSGIEYQGTDGERSLPEEVHFDMRK